MKLLFQVIIKFVLGVLMIGILLFLPAGTFFYWNAWLLMGLLFIPMFILGFIIAGLDFRYGWSNIPTTVIAIASVILVIAYALYAEVMRENTYLSRTIEVQENQKVVDTGLYKIIRHPMYFATTLLFLSFPIVLGSWISFAIFCFLPFVLVKRIKNEEIILEKGLKGYKEYKQKVKYKMIPFVW